MPRFRHQRYEEVRHLHVRGDALYRLRGIGARGTLVPVVGSCHGGARPKVTLGYDHGKLV